MKLDGEWDTALPYSSIPGPSKYATIRGFAPGGNFQLEIEFTFDQNENNICFFHDFLQENIMVYK